MRNSPDIAMQKNFFYSVEIRYAISSEAKFLTELAARSKAHWPYGDKYWALKTKQPFAIYSSLEPSSGKVF